MSDDAQVQRALAIASEARRQEQNQSHPLHEGSDYCGLGFAVQ